MKTSDSKRFISLDLIRILAILLIFTYHFGITFNMQNSIVCRYRNGDWGCIGTTVFFILSGYVIRLHYPKVENLKSFYFKRFLAIYPMFYITFLGAYLFHSIMERNFLYGGHPAKLLLSFIGFDKYALFFGISSYQIVGEWFTAIIVLIYLLYPLLSSFFGQYEMVMTIIIAVLYGLNLYFEFFGITAEASIFTGLFLFYIGMVIQSHSNQIMGNKWITLGAFFIIAVLLVVPLPIEHLLFKNIFGICLFLLILNVCGGIEANTGGSKIILFFSQISYGVYLSHHFIINSFYAKFGHLFAGMGRTVISYVIVLTGTYVTSYVLLRLTNAIVKRRIR